MQLPREARQVLLELELVSAGPVQSMDAEGGRSTDRPARPSGPSAQHDAVPHLYWRRLMMQEPHRLQEHIQGAQEALERLLKAPEPVEAVPEPREDMEGRALREGEGFPVHMVLLNFPDLTRRQLIALRVSDGRSVETGYRVKEHADDPQERLERALVMRTQGMSYRQVQMLTGVPRQTVCDAEKKRAA